MVWGPRDQGLTSAVLATCIPPWDPASGGVATRIHRVAVAFEHAGDSGGGADPSLLVQGLWSVPSGIVQISLALLVLWYEGGTLRSIGLSRREFGPALVVVTGFLILLNLIVVGLVLLREARLSIGLFALYRSPPLNSTRTLIAVGAVSEYVFVGPVEELAFRGYLQNKLVALLDRDIPVSIRPSGSWVRPLPSRSCTSRPRYCWTDWPSHR